MKKIVIIALMLFAVGCEKKANSEIEPYDPNVPQYRYLEVTEPNWVAAFGDTLETRMLYNISKNRVKIAMLEKRLAVLENPIVPNAVVEVKVKE